MTHWKRQAGVGLILLLSLVTAQIISINGLAEERFFRSLGPTTSTNSRSYPKLSAQEIQQFVNTTFPKRTTPPPRVNYQGYLEIIADKTGREKIRERDGWIKLGIFGEILSQPKIVTRFNEQLLQAAFEISEVIIISAQVEWGDTESSWSVPRFFQALSNLNLKNNVGVYDISSDCSSKPWHSQAKFILKEYPCLELFKKENIFWVPRGWADSFVTQWNPSSFVTSTERSLMFYGESNFLLDSILSNNEILEQIRGEFYLDKDPVKYHLRLRDSAFVLCPTSDLTNPCIFDALHNGAIPIVALTAHKNTEWSVLENKPFPVIRNWQSLPALLRYYRENLHLLNELQERVIIWWDDYQENLKSRVFSYFAPLWFEPFNH